MRRNRWVESIGARAEDDGRGVPGETLEEGDHAFAIELTMQVGRPGDEWHRAPPRDHVALAIGLHEYVGDRRRVDGRPQRERRCPAVEIEQKWGVTASR